jgi:hypothetical protein
MVAEAWYKEEILVMLCWMKVDSSVLLGGRAVDGSARRSTEPVDDRQRGQDRQQTTFEKVATR